MKYEIYLFGGLYDEVETETDAIAYQAFLEDEHGSGSVSIEYSDFPISDNNMPYWADDVIY